MKVYLKVHIKEEFEIIACCDEELLNQVFKIEIASSRAINFPSKNWLEISILKFPSLKT